MTGYIILLSQALSIPKYDWKAICSIGSNGWIFDRDLFDWFAGNKRFKALVFDVE